MAYKVFTNGSVLNASEINDNLMNQSVMVFSNSTTRAAALTAPVEGMLTWLQDVNRYENYNGTAWVALSESGLTLINATSFTAQSTVSLNNVFSADYRNYKIILEHTASANIAVDLRLRSGTDNSSANYWTNTLLAAATTVSATGPTTAQTSFLRVSEYETGISTSEITIYSPFATSVTSLTTTSQFRYTSFYQHLRLTSGQTTVTTSYDGFTLIPTSGNITGTLKVYGLKG